MYYRCCCQNAIKKELWQCWIYMYIHIYIYITLEISKCWKGVGNHNARCSTWIKNELTYETLFDFTKRSIKSLNLLLCDENVSDLCSFSRSTCTMAVYKFNDLAFLDNVVFTFFEEVPVLKTWKRTKSFIFARHDIHRQCSNVSRQRNAKLCCRLSLSWNGWSKL